MENNKLIKLIVLNSVIAIANVVLFSPGLIGIKIGGGNSLSTAFGMTIIVMSSVIFIMGNYWILVPKIKHIQTDEIETVIDYIDALKGHSDKKTFEKDIILILEQIQRFEKKKDTIHTLLNQKFTETEMSYIKFQTALTNVEKLLYMNIRSILNKFDAFDQEDYDYIQKAVKQGELREAFSDTKMSIYKQYIDFIKESVEDNEEILLKLDRLLLELSKLNTLEEGELENMIAMQEIDELIQKAKFYK